MKTFFVKHGATLLSGVAGAIAGFLYWRFVGCTSGSCPIQSVWYWSTLRGALAGYLIGDIVRDLVKRNKTKKDAGEV